MRNLFEHVKADFDKRNEIGHKNSGGKELYHTNKLNFLQEAYEEALDLVIYLKGEILRRRETHRKYRLSPKGKASLQKYRLSPKRRAVWLKYNNSLKGKAAVAKYQLTEKGRAKNLRYSRKPERVERAKWQNRGYKTRNRIKALL